MHAQVVPEVDVLPSLRPVTIKQLLNASQVESPPVTKFTIDGIMLGFVSWFTYVVHRLLPK